MGGASRRKSGLRGYPHLRFCLLPASGELSGSQRHDETKTINNDDNDNDNDKNALQLMMSQVCTGCSVCNATVTPLEISHSTTWDVNHMQMQFAGLHTMPAMSSIATIAQASQQTWLATFLQPAILPVMMSSKPKQFS